jgi:hypothetical protein
MDFDAEYFNQKKERAKDLYIAQKSIYCPYFKCEVVLNSDSFHHLQFSDRSERNKKEQLLKFSLLPLALKVIKNSGTIQEHRKGIITIGQAGKDGLRQTKNVEYWAFIAIVGDSEIKIRVITRRIGDGNFIFWSVMPDSNLKKGQKLCTDGIEDE